MTDNKVAGALGTAAPYALIIGLGYLALKLFEGIAPAAAQAAGGSVGGAGGGFLSGVITGAGKALGMEPDLSGILAKEILPADAGGLRKTALITNPPNNGAASRPLMSSTYKVQAVVNWDSEQAVLMTFNVQEYPRVVGANGVQQKTSTVKLHPGRNVVEVLMPWGGGLLTDCVLSLLIDGVQYTSSAYTCE